MCQQTCQQKADLLQLLLHRQLHLLPVCSRPDNNLSKSTTTFLSPPTHLVNVHGGAGPAQAPELGDHGGVGLGGGGGLDHGGGTRPSGQPLVTLDSPGCWWSDFGSRLPWVVATVDPRGWIQWRHSRHCHTLTPHNRWGRAVGGCRC